MTKTITPGRLAFRVEGDMWNAYFAKLENMDGAVLLGSIAMTFVADKEDRKIAFIEMMKSCFEDFCQEVVGARAEWDEPTRAPEHERSGHA